MKTVGPINTLPAPAPLQPGFRQGQAAESPPGKSPSGFSGIIARLSAGIVAVTGTVRSSGEEPPALASDPVTAQTLPGPAEQKPDALARIGQRPLPDTALAPTTVPDTDKALADAQSADPMPGSLAPVLPGQTLPEVPPARAAVGSGAVMTLPLSSFRLAAAPQTLPGGDSLPAQSGAASGRSTSPAPGASFEALTKLRPAAQASASASAGIDRPFFQSEHSALAETRGQMLRALTGLAAGSGAQGSSGTVGTALLNSLSGSGDVRLDGAPLGARPAPISEWAPIAVARQSPHWSQDLMAALGDRLTMQVNQTVKEATVRLDPPELGRIEMLVRLDGDRLNIQLNTGNAQVRDMLTQHAERLRLDLAQQNAQTVEVNVGQDNHPQRHSRQATPEPETIAAALPLAEEIPAHDSALIDNGWISTSA